jgi:hypothetical protein
MDSFGHRYSQLANELTFLVSAAEFLATAKILRLRVRNLA